MSVADIGRAGTWAVDTCPGGRGAGRADGSAVTVPFCQPGQIGALQGAPNAATGRPLKQSHPQRLGSLIVAFIDRFDERLSHAPGRIGRFASHHHELIKFALVGGITAIFDMAIFFGLTLTVLSDKPATAKVFSGVMAVILSYILNREWSFKHRGGRERHHEALLFFVISGIGVLIMAFPVWFAHNVLDVDTRYDNHPIRLAAADFVLAYLLGNLMQMAFRFWALRRFAFPGERPIDLHDTLLPPPDVSDTDHPAAS